MPFIKKGGKRGWPKGRPRKVNKQLHEEKQGTTPPPPPPPPPNNNNNNVGNLRQQRQVPEVVMDSSSISITSTNEADSNWKCPHHIRQHLAPDSAMISCRQATLRSSKRLRPEVVKSAAAQKSSEHLIATAVLEQRDDLTYQAPATAMPLGIAANPSNVAPDTSDQVTDKLGDSVSSHGYTKEISESSTVGSMPEIQMPRNNLTEEPSTFQAESFGLSEMINLCRDKDDEVHSSGRGLPVNTVDKYKVKEEWKYILTKIFSNHGDIASNCIGEREFRIMLLERVCGIIKELQDKDILGIKEARLQELIALVNEISKMKVDVEWLRQKLLEILETKKVVKQSSLLKEEEECNRKAIKNMEREVKEYEEEEKAAAAKVQAGKEKLSRARDESARLAAAMADAKSKAKRFLSRSVIDGLI